MKPISDEEFDDYVYQAIESIDDQFRQYLDAVPVIVVDQPDSKTIQKTPHIKGLILGLFQGVPLHLHKEGFPVPSQITLYRKNITLVCPDTDSLIEQIRRTVVHELGHYLGFSDEQLRNHDY